MRDTVAGAVLAVVFLALLFAAPRFLPRGVEGAERADVNRITRAFSGSRFIGPWSLACAQSPPASPQPGAGGTQGKVGRCRMARDYKTRNGQLVLAVVFRYAEPGEVLTMIVRFPPVGRSGEYLLIRLGPKSGLRLPIYGCMKGSCVAVGTLTPAAETLLLSGPIAQVVLPPRSDGKQYTIGIRLDGLGLALAGMKRAEL
jgi:invasion protein IalB